MNNIRSAILELFHGERLGDMNTRSVAMWTAYQQHKSNSHKISLLAHLDVRSPPLS